MRTLYISIFLLLIGVSGIAQEKYSIISYPIGFAMGDTKDFIDQTSFRGLGIEVGRFIADDKASIGFQTNFQTFYQELEKDTYPIENGAITGKQYRYITSIPLLAKGMYYPTGQEATVIPHVGLGVGTYYLDKESSIGLYGTRTNVWHFGLCPQAGVSIPLNIRTNFNINAEYNMAVKTQKHDAESWLTLSFGFKYIY